MCLAWWMRVFATNMWSDPLLPFVNAPLNGCEMCLSFINVVMHLFRILEYNLPKQLVMDIGGYCGNCDEEYVLLKSWWMKSEQVGLIAISISLEMLSCPVALDVAGECILEFISEMEMGASLSREVGEGVGGFSLYWEHENCVSSEFILGLFSL